MPRIPYCIEDFVVVSNRRGLKSLAVLKPAACHDDGQCRDSFFAADHVFPFSRIVMNFLAKKGSDLR
jgi:hypothetical protein